MKNEHLLKFTIGQNRRQVGAMKKKNEESAQHEKLRKSSRSNIFSETPKKSVSEWPKRHQKWTNDPWETFLSIRLQNPENVLWTIFSTIFRNIIGGPIFRHCCLDFLDHDHKNLE